MTSAPPVVVDTSVAEVVTADEPLYQAVHAHLPHVWWLGNWPQQPQ